MKYENGIFLCDGSLVYIPVGFQPDKVEMWEMTADAFMFIWHRILEDSGVASALSSIEGIKLDVDGGAGTLLADDGGFASYDSGAAAPSISAWTSSVATNATARTATAPGTYVKPSTSGTNVDGQAADREAVFECVTAGTSSGTEPNWPVGIGEQVLDNDVRFELISKPTYRKGYQGFRVAAALMTDGDYHIYDAWQADKSTVWGDVDGWTSGVYDEKLTETT